MLTIRSLLVCRSFKEQRFAMVCRLVLPLSCLPECKGKEEGDAVCLSFIFFLCVALASGSDLSFFFLFRR